jgi:hypothetical protein
MKRLLLSLLFIPYLLHAQKVINVEYPSEGNIVLSQKMTLPKIKSGYTLWLPNEESKGMIVFFQ